MDDELGLVRRLFAEVGGRAVEITTPSQEEGAQLDLLLTGVAEAKVYFLEGDEKIYTGRHLRAKRLGRVM